MHICNDCQRCQLNVKPKTYFKQTILCVNVLKYIKVQFNMAYIYIYISHRSEYTHYIFINIYYIFSCDNTEEMTLCYNVK